MNRKSNFKNDNEKYGKFGERIFIEYAKHNQWYIEDVSDLESYRPLDIDFLYIKNREWNAERLLNENQFRGNVTNARMANDAIAFEVKADTVTRKYGNVVYELLSHDRPGCLARSLADFVFYVQIDEINGKLIAEKAWNINLHKWRTWLREHDKKVNGENSPVRLNNFNTSGDKCLNFLCSINALVKDGVAKEIDLKKFYEQ